MRTRCFVLILALSGVALAGACVDHLPDQDLRILAATPSAKLSVDLLWKEYRDDAAKADRTYKGKAILITGTVKLKTADAAAPPAAPAAAASQAKPAPVRLEFPQDATSGVVAYLLDEQSAELVALAAATPRMTIKCFVQGREAGNSDVILKSCVKP